MTKIRYSAGSMKTPNNKKTAPVVQMGHHFLQNNGHHVMKLTTHRQSSELNAKEKKRGCVFMFSKELTAGDNLLYPQMILRL